jgi:trimeric autotransporter adhesin
MLHRVCRLAVALVIFVLTAVLPAAAQVAPPRNSPLARLSFSAPSLRPTSTAEPLEQVAALVPPELRDGWARFTAEAGGSWQAYVDRRTGKLEVAEGSGIPWIPGDGNTLAEAGKADMAALEGIAHAFLPKVAPLLGVEPSSLVLSPGRSGQPSPALWLVDFDVRRDGRTIEGARVVFRVSNGNLVQFGSVGLPAERAATPVAAVDRRQALQALSTFIGGFGAADSFVDGGSLHLLPVSTSDPRFAEGFEPGKGRGLALVWQLVFRRAKQAGTWRGRVDAATGEVLEFRDVNEYAKVNGGVYTDSFATGSEVVLPMPFADVPPVGTTNSAGVYNYPGGAVASTLDGLYVQIVDSCGAISKSASGSGRIAFGTSAGTDCATPGSGGAGNTHSARTQFYHLNRIKETGRAWLPGNTWLNAQLTARVNLNQTCNAYWYGGAVNFFRSGGGCGNTGEIAGVSLHEYGHGLDENDGNGFSPDFGTGESYGDFTAALVTHRSCQGDGFFTGNCGGYGDPCTACSGVRDMDWAKHASNTPHTVDNFTRLNCGSGFGYDGPCGGEGHCESYVISEALWDFVARDLPSPGSAGAWSTAERLWYLSRSTTGSAFTCNTAAATWTSDGCAAGSLWRTFRAADDDDGNLANGTPHSCKLFAAFNRHGLACASDPGANVCFAACTPPASPTLSLTPGDGQVALSWTSAGPGIVYDVFKSDLGCSSGFTRVANDATATTFTDTSVANALAYSYQVIAHPSGNESCGAAPSACQSATPQGPPCVPPAAPGSVTAAAAGVDKITVTWSAVPGATDYLVFRADVSGGPYTQVASVPDPATSWTDNGLNEGTRYYYVVKAAAEECLSAISAEATAVTGVCAPVTLYTNDFETGTGLSDWTVDVDFGTAADWRGIQSCAAHSGDKIFRFGGPSCNLEYEIGEHLIASPHGASGIAVPAGTSRTRLSFWHRWSFEYGYDGGWLGLSVDGSAPVNVPASAIVGGTGYTDNFQFTGEQSTFVNSVVDLDAACDLVLGSGGCAGHTIEIGFNTYSDGSIVSTGWFLDDVTVTACAAHGCTGAPVIGTVTTPANNQVQVTWSNGAPPSASYNVYRALGTCAAPGSYERIGSAVAGSPFLDTDASGGSTFAYRVAGLDAGGLCESDLSGCVQAVPTGPCTLRPLFAGLATATDPSLSTCTLDLSWAAGSARCAGPVTYSVYRGTAPDFLPGPGNLVASGLTGTAFSDLGPLLSRAPYFYVVRAVDGSNGRDDGNTVRLGAFPTGPLVLPGTRVDTFEGAQSGGGFDLDDWTHSPINGAQDWMWDGAFAQSPDHSWLAPQIGATADQVLVSPLFVPRNGTSVSFWHTYAFENLYDGGTLEISTDHGANWSVVPDAAFTAGGYNATLHTGTTNPLAGQRAWTGGSFGTATLTRADLSAWAGAEVRVRWHAGEDAIVGVTGWAVDSVTIANAGFGGSCQSAPPPPLSFYTVTPCRLIDTRGSNGPLGGPVLEPGAIRAFTATAACGVPVTAKALSMNATITQPNAPGFLTFYPGGQLLPGTSSLNFSPGQTRANNLVVPLGDGTGILQVFTAGGQVHLILDVNGYFQ